MAAPAATTATPPFASRQRGGRASLPLKFLARLDRPGQDSNALFASQSQSFLQGGRRFCFLPGGRSRRQLSGCRFSSQAVLRERVTRAGAAAHKHPKVIAWLGRHPRFTFHFTPTSCSWLNAVETFFATLTKRRLKRGVFRSVVDLQAAINRYLADANHDPKPFTWTANPDKIIAAVNRGRQALESIH